MLVGDLEIGDDPIEAQEELRIRCVSAVHDAAIDLGYVKLVPPVRVQIRGNGSNESFDYDSNPY